tara:strand:+ start:420 stop:1097 length:678 start_codon:yes stop_codon:yes gene_type:complete
MANFQAQVEALTGVTVSTTPTTSELSQFLKDGVMDVTNKCTEKDPREEMHFIKESAEQTSNGALDLNGAKIISVIREADVNNQWEECRFVSPGSQYKVTDTESLDFASIYNPAYTILSNGTISVFPVPDTGGAKSFKVYYVNNVPVDKGESALIHSHSDIGFFDDNKVYLVVIYAAIKTLELKMADFAVEEEDIEMVQAMTQNLASLKQQYESAFVSMYKDKGGK